MKKASKRPRLFFSAYDEYGAMSSTAGEVYEAGDDVETGLLDASGQPIKAKSVKIPLGFKIP